MTVVLATTVMIILHGASGVEIDVNSQEITHLRRPEAGNHSFPANVHCMVNLADGKFVTVQETCEQVRDAIGGRK